MKAKADDDVVLLEAKPGIGGTNLPAGTRGSIVEAYAEPTEGYAVDLRLADAELVGGYSWHTVSLFPSQFRVVEGWEQEPVQGPTSGDQA